MTPRTQFICARRWSRSAGLTCLLALSAAPQAGAVAAPAEPAIAADVRVPEAKVTLEARHLPLSQVLAEVKKQTGANLTIAAGTFAHEPKLTLSVTTMPLRECMESLAKLYDVVWQAAGANAFELRLSGLSEDEKALRHMGSAYNYWAWPFDDGRRPEYLPPRAAPDWKALVDDNLDLNAITTTGVPLADAPTELQQATRTEIEHKVAADLLLDTLLLNAAHGPLSISTARTPGLSGYILNQGKRNEKKFLHPNPLNVDITNKDGVSLGRFYLRPPTRGRELLSEHDVFPWVDPNAPLTKAAPQAAPQEGK